jgi:molybdopterin-guanine dinucleotide biosynthesis protein A
MEARTRVVPLTQDAALVVLAGGRSSRMGRAKRDLPVGTGTLLEWIVARLGSAFAETLVAGGPAPRGARAVADRHADAGPLAGIEASLLAMRGEHAFVIACDTPRASARLAALLLERSAGADAAVPRVAGRVQPTCAVYARTAAPKLGAYLDAGERRATEALDQLEVAYIDERDLTAAGVSLSELDDLDTPADYDAFITSLRA